MQLSTARLGHAIHALTEILPLTHPADATLSRYFRNNPELGQKDRAFVAETVYAVLRRKRLLEHLAAPHLTPRHLVLALLARVQGLSLRELEPLLYEGESDWLKQVKGVSTDDLSLAARADFPDWLAERLAAHMAEEEILALARGMQQPAPLDLRANTVLANRDEVLAILKRDGIPAEAMPYSPIGVRIREKPAINRHPLFLTGKIEVQDEGSQLIGYLVAPKRGEMIADFCAGAGGKTLLLGALMHSLGRIYAFDVSAKRLTQLKPRLKRSGLSNLHPQLISNENDIKIKRLAGKLDRVLVDAPCSGLGTLRRNPDLKWRQKPQDIAELTVKQAAILNAAARLVKVGGRLVYATCSILEEENEQIVEAFLAAHPEFELHAASEVLAQQNIALDTGKYFKLVPHVHGTDGFFAAVMERKG
ncbi:MAG: RsmB/NOP family class I SAM-dependent RNA methyltransferase [Betaproteobacteria bacterium]|nr:RsmB/NOP family class I SAM-dependent RNA methyltransferase [Betaproteobacteria bacterium]